MAARLLTPDGSFWLLTNHENAAHSHTSLEATGLHWRRTIVWYERFGVNCSRSFNRTSRPLLYFTRDPRQLVFNRQAVTRPSARQTKYRDRRAAAGGKLWDDVWQIPRLCGTHRERIAGFPTQLPLALLRPIVGCATDPGDLVVDPFCGSGTTGVVSIEAGRRFIGIEQQRRFVGKARARLEATSA